MNVTTFDAILAITRVSARETLVTIITAMIVHEANESHKLCRVAQDNALLDPWWREEFQWAACWVSAKTQEELARWATYVCQTASDGRILPTDRIRTEVATSLRLFNLVGKSGKIYTQAIGIPTTYELTVEAGGEDCTWLKVE